MHWTHSSSRILHRSKPQDQSCRSRPSRRLPVLRKGHHLGLSKKLKRMSILVQVYLVKRRPGAEVDMAPAGQVSYTATVIRCGERDVLALQPTLLPLGRRDGRTATLIGHPNRQLLAMPVTRGLPVLKQWHLQMEQSRLPEIKCILRCPNQHCPR